MFGWGMWAIFAGHALDHASAGATLALTYVTATTIVAVARYDTMFDVGSEWAIVFGIGSGIAMAVGTLAFYRSLSAGGAAVTSAIAGLYFVVTTVYDILVLGNPVDFSKIAGILLACVAIGLLVR
jgi:uncharacterized membrane protein